MAKTGTIAWYSAARGFGFIAPDGRGPDVIVHASELSGSTLTALGAGTRVAFDARASETEPEAINLVVLGRAARS